MNHIINLGIFAHVDAGKTSLTEDLLFSTHNTVHPGKVDDGTTITDTMDLERKRGITIQETTISFNYQDLQINLLDTPGHPDFIAEVERSLQVIDCAILVISAIEGIQAQTRKLFAILEQHHTPTMIFINKIDRPGFNYEQTKKVLAEQLTHRFILMQDAQFQPISIYESLLDFDEHLAERYLREESLTEDDYQESYLRLLNHGSIYPVFFGSALHHLHTKILVSHLHDFRPIYPLYPDVPAAFVYKIKYINHHRHTFFKVFSGTISRKDDFNGKKIRHLAKLDLNQLTDCHSVGSHHIGVLIDDYNYHAGQWIGTPLALDSSYTFSPNLSTTVTINDSANRQSVITRLMEMNDEDPFLDFAIMPDGTLTLKLFGEIQKEVIQAQVPVTFSESRTIYQESILKKGTYTIDIRDKINPWSAGLSISCQPLVQGSGLQYQSKVDFGYLKQPFQTAVEEAIYEAAKEGSYGWQITDTLVTLESAQFDSVSSTPADFRSLAPLVFMQAFIAGDVFLLAPVDQFKIIFPHIYLSSIYYSIYCYEGKILQEKYSDKQTVLLGTLPTASSSLLSLEIMRITQGTGLFSSHYLCHQSTDQTFTNPYRLHPDASNIRKYLLQKSQRIK